MFIKHQNDIHNRNYWNDLKGDADGILHNFN